MIRDLRGISYATPLRYPGGKQKLTPFVVEILKANALLDGDYVEPYAGGAGVAMQLLLGGFVKRVHLNDCCIGIYAFWTSVLEEPDALCKKIIETPLTIPEWRRQQDILKRPDEFERLDVGFSQFYLNRCNRSGITNGGLIGGLSQSGDWRMDARFPREKLAKRIKAIAERKAQISFYGLDAEEFIQEYVPKLDAKTLVYCDPPYFRKAPRLYENFYSASDHQRLAHTIQTSLTRPWIVSYDYAPEITKEYPLRRSFVYDLQYSAANTNQGKEVFFFSDGLKLPTSSLIPSIDHVLRMRSKLSAAMFL